MDYGMKKQNKTKKSMSENVEIKNYGLTIS